MVARASLAAIGCVLVLASAGCAGGRAAGAATVGPSASVIQVTADPHHHRSGQPALRPPAPRVSTLGVTRIATLVSYCWFASGQGICADGAPGHAAQILRWNSNTPVRVELRLAAHDVHFETARVIAPGAERDLAHLRAPPLDRVGRRWIFCLPPRARRANDLLIFARYARGDMLADLRLVPARTPPTHTLSPVVQRCP
jgi:hypothetical protein